MVVKGIIKTGEYHDSVTLMRVAKYVSEQPGVNDSAVVMATVENKHILQVAGLLMPELQKAKETDLIIVVRAQTSEQAVKFLSEAVQQLKRKTKSTGSHYQPKSLESAVSILPEANLVLISIAGRYAGDEAMRALKKGLHVMLFSDNVPLEQEIELKKYAVQRGLLVMGPDAGTAIINGIPLAFANSVNRGNIGIVAASGTGLQEVSTLLSNAGFGISQAIGTGGRDVKNEVGGLMFLQGIEALLEDPETKVILLISKPPHESVLKKILLAVQKSKKPIVTTFLGATSELFSQAGVIPTVSLEEGALVAASLVQGGSSTKTKNEVAREIDAKRKQFDTTADIEAKKLGTGQKFLRALYTGGTYVGETQVLLNEKIKEVYSNAPLGSAQWLDDSSRSQANTIIDFGEDEFTVGRPHPMIDFSLRNKRILEEARDPQAAVLLLDLVLGWGAHRNPLPELVPVLVKAREIAETAGRYLPIVMSVTGTDSDPQCRSTVVSALKAIGVLVVDSNASAAYLAGKIVENVR